MYLFLPCRYMGISWLRKRTNLDNGLVSDIRQISICTSDELIQWCTAYIYNVLRIRQQTINLSSVRPFVTKPVIGHHSSWRTCC